MTAANQQVFISYQRTDSDFARQVREHLVGAGVRAWMDQYDIPVGAYWPDEIDKALLASDIVVGILSPDAVESRNVKNEWDWAIQNDKRLLLLQVEPCVIPHRYVSINFIDATADEISRALAALSETLGIRAGVEDDFEVPETRYARSGDLSIAYQIVGDGPVDLVYVPGFVSHVEHYWMHPSHAHYLRSLSSFARLILFDKRGTGLSDRTARVATMEERMEDIHAVMDAAGSARAVIYGVSEGVALASLFAATYPGRTISLILYSSFASYVARDDYPWRPAVDELEQRIDRDAELIHETWGTVENARDVIDVFAPSALHDEGYVQWFATLLKLGASPGAEIARRRMNLDLDIRHVLPTIRVPTVVIHRTGDRDANVEEGRYTADRIPDAQFVELPGNDHSPAVGDVDRLIDEIETFAMRTHRATRFDANTVLATIVSIAPRGNVGPNAQARFTGVVPGLLERYRGRDVSPDNGNVVAVFDGPTRAIRWAAATVELAKNLRIPVGAGLHIGEIAVFESDAQGAALDTASRLATQAEDGQILATMMVRDLVAGSGIAFIDRGIQQIGAVAESWQLFSVDPGSV